MRSDASNKDEVRTYVGKVRDALGDPRLADVIARAAAQVPGDAAPRDKIAALLSPDLDSMASSGGEPPGVPYLSRAPLVSMVQSHVEQALGEAGVPDPAGHPGPARARPARGRGSSGPSSVPCTSHRTPSRRAIPTGTSLSPAAFSSASRKAMRPSTRHPPNTTAWPTTPAWWSWVTGARACRVPAMSPPTCRKGSARRWPITARCTCSTSATSITPGWRPRTGSGSSICGRSLWTRPVRA